MPLATMALKPIEKLLPTVIDARTHGIIDYSHAAFFFGMALLCRKKNPRAALAAALTGAFVLTEALLTDYPLGLASVIPFAAHGRLDTVFASSSWAVPRLFGFEDTAAAHVFKTNSFVEAAIVGLTNFDSQAARAEE